MSTGMHTQNITVESNAILRRLWRIKSLDTREKNDVCPEHNAGMAVVPQILTNRAEDFLAIAEILREYGYDTVNLNLGCPSGTVAARGRGAGFLAMPDELDHFLEEIFEKWSAPDLHQDTDRKREPRGMGASACHI